jgi:ATP-dependent DNA ligase
MQHELTIMGSVSAVLYIRSTNEHTDFYARLCDVAPNGKSINICDGIVRLKPGSSEFDPDGVRCIAYLDKDNTILRNKRNKDVTDIYPELKDIYKNAKKRCILDGELVVLNKEGKPSFFDLQKRTLLTNKMRIDMLSKRNPVQFVAYDILFIDDRQITDLPLMERKYLLSKNVSDFGQLSVSRYIEEKGKDFFNLAKSQGLEGVVAKLKDSKYYIGKRSRDWLKIKVLQDEDLYIIGYQPKDDGTGVKDVILADIVGDTVTERNKVYMGVSKSDERMILDFARKNKTERPENTKYPDPGIVWIKPELVGVVEYMMLTESGGMRQPVFKGVRSD